MTGANMHIPGYVTEILNEEQNWEILPVRFYDIVKEEMYDRFEALLNIQ